MKYSLQDLIDIDHFQKLQDRLNKIYSFPSSIIDNDGNILTATAWQDVCTKFHRKNKETEQLCIKSDQYIYDHIHEANPAISYRCPHGLMDNAAPIIIDGIHYGNFFTGQFFLEEPDLEFFRTQAKKYGFDEEAYIAAVKRVPIWTQDQLENYIFFIKGLIAVISESGMKNLKEIEHRKQIQKSEKRYRSILKAAIDGYWLTDINGGLLEVNDAYCRMSGYSEDELLNMNIPDLEAIETPEIVAEHMQTLILKGSDRFETKHRRKDGAVFDVEVSIQFRPEDGGQCVCFLRDITDTKRAEKDLLESKAFLENMSDVAYMADDQGNLLWINPAAELVTGLSLDEMIGKPFVPLFIQTDQPSLIEAYQRTLAGESLENTLTLKSGVTCHFSSLPKRNQHGDIIGTFGVARDISKQQAAERALQTSETRLKKAQAMAKVGNWEYNLETETFWGSDEVKKIFRLDPAKDHFSVEAVEKHIPERQKVHQALVDLIEKGKPYNLEYDILTKSDNRLKTIASIAELEKDAAGNPVKVSGVVQDITEQKKAEKSRKKYEKDLENRNFFIQTVLDNLPIGLAVNYINEGTATYMNKKFEEIYGWPKQQLKNIAEFFHKVYPDQEYREKLMKQVLQDIESGDPERMVWERMEITREDGEKRIISAKNIALYEQNLMISTVQDITDRKRAEKALRHNHEMLKLTEAMANIGSWEWDVQHDRTNWSEELFRIFGRNPAGGAPPFAEQSELYDNGDMQRLKDVVEICVKQGKSYEIELKAIRPDNEIRHCISRGQPQYDENGEVSRITGSFQDITERKNLQNQLLQAQKMESVGRLAGGVAHDFNNMLGVILGHTELALLQADENHDLYSDLIEIQKAAKRSADVTKQLLAFARKQTISPRQLDLNDTVESMLNMLRRLIGENIDLVWQPASDLWPVKMDPSQIDQILANLCINARDAIAGVGKLTIETGIKTFDEEYCNENFGFIPGDFVMLAVSDNGCGMDKCTLENLFEPFFTTKEVGKGTGLGLATVFGIVKQNNGFINVYSEPGQGSTFKMYLPRIAEEEGADNVVPEKKAVVTGTETILLVEDEPSILKMTQIILKRNGYTVLPAASPSEAMEKATNHSGSIDLLMSDVVMPEMNGRDLAAKVKALRPDITLLFMSGYTENVIVHQGVLDAGVAFIQKPFSMADMTKKVREVLDSATDKNPG